ncbi:CHAD domain-containing protein [Massilia sp. R2A-15]|uniref:CYTH and CHAD domain-containing protein n=1 Tax=Massilia sp. R2A-15 TaxID=3064278 RepID=UPI002732B0F0|nr:CYTH and CHAD domain-containing protein [Massilia sp. R2A-15]WLI90553.1 CHAD domain-containing protein [Massilia sp. R2A-15]
MEIELKLQLDAKAREKLLHHHLFHGGAKPREETLADTYFDTPRLRLRRHDVGLRVREVGKRWIQTMKNGAGANGGLHQRGEWESPVDRPTPDLARLRELVDEKQIRRDALGADSLEQRLAPVFSTHIKRTVWDLHLKKGVHVECALDVGTLEHGTEKAPISELELELKAGDPAQLFDLALDLLKDVPFRIANLSKADRGYALLAPQPRVAVKAKPLTLERAMPLDQAFQQIVSNCLAHIQDNADNVAKVRDVESLHQMRVGMRRLRSALGMFKDVLRLPEALQLELDWLADELGSARDWDVLAETTLPSMARVLPEPARIAGVARAAADKAKQHHASAAAAAGSVRYTRLMLGITRWLEAKGWRDDARATQAAAGVLDQPVRKFARQILKRDERRLRRRARALSTATPEQRHRVRIAAKKTRYAAEFFSSLFPQRRVRPYVKALTGLQDELGLLNDITVATRLLTEISESEPALALEVGFAEGMLAARIPDEGKLATKRWKKLAKVPLPC